MNPNELKKPKSSYLWTVLNNKCPHCREGNMFKDKGSYHLKTFMKMNEECPVCGQKTEIEEGFYIGGFFIIGFPTETREEIEQTIRFACSLPLDRIGVLIHPESIVHSMVEFRDKSVLAQMSLPDMRFAIQYALMYPERVDGRLPELDVASLGALHFSAPDPKRFPCIGLARQAAAQGGTMPVVLNAANEVAVQQFLDQRIALTGIWRIVEGVMEQHSVMAAPSLDDIMAADVWARRAADAVAARVAVR